MNCQPADQFEFEADAVTCLPCAASGKQQLHCNRGAWPRLSIPTTTVEEPTLKQKLFAGRTLWQQAQQQLRWAH